MHKVPESEARNPKLKRTHHGLTGIYEEDQNDANTGTQLGGYIYNIYKIAEARSKQT